MPDGKHFVQFPRFVVVGAVGFATDLGLLLAFLALGAPNLLSRALSAALAICVTFVLNRAFAFRHAPGAPIPSQFARYVGVQGAGATLNYTIYAVLTEFAHLGPVISLVVASGTAMCVNYMGLDKLVFRHRDVREPEPGPHR